MRIRARSSMACSLLDPGRARKPDYRCDWTIDVTVSVNPNSSRALM